MRNTRTLAFVIDKAIADLVTEDAGNDHTNESSILRQIVFKHYNSDPRLKKNGDSKTKETAAQS